MTLNGTFARYHDGRSNLFENNLIGFVAISAHGPDIGGRLYTWALSTDIYEEGLRIPICKYAMAGKRDHTVKRFIVNNVRVPEKVNILRYGILLPYCFKSNN